MRKTPTIHPKVRSGLFKSESNVNIHHLLKKNKSIHTIHVWRRYKRIRGDACEMATEKNLFVWSVWPAQTEISNMQNHSRSAMCHRFTRWSISGTWTDMKNDTSYLSPLNACTQGEHENARPMGLRRTHVNSETGRPGQNSECTHTKKALVPFTGACSSSHISARAGQRYRTHSVQYLKQVVSAARMHNCLFIYSTLVNAKNQFGPADILAITSH